MEEGLSDGVYLTLAVLDFLGDDGEVLVFADEGKKWFDFTKLCLCCRHFLS